MHAAGWERMLAVATRAEALGLHSVWLPENHFAPSATPAPLVALAAFAARTRRLRLATSSLLLPLHPPRRLAAEVATLDALSGGRVLLGLGRGFRAGVFEGFGVRARDKRDRFDAALDTMLSAWASAAPTAKRPHPPLLVAAFGPKGLAQAARRGLPYLASPLETLDALAHNYALWRELCEQEKSRAQNKDARSGDAQSESGRDGDGGGDGARNGGAQNEDARSESARGDDGGDGARSDDAQNEVARRDGAKVERAQSDGAEVRRAQSEDARDGGAQNESARARDVRGGDAPRVPVMRNVFVAANDAEAGRVRDALRAESARLAGTRAPNPVLARAAAGEIEERALIGGAAQVEDEIARYRERLGLDLLVARVEFAGADAAARDAALERLAQIICTQ